MRESWTDERLDDFRAETAWRFDGIDESHQVMLQFGAGALVTFVVGFASLIVTQL